MAKSKRQVERIHTDLEIDEHLPMQETAWKIQLAGIVFIFALVFTAAIGLYGDGITSNKKLAENNIVVEYERFYRFESRMDLKVAVASAANDLVVSFPAEYLKNFQVESIVPEPYGNAFKNHQVEYTFKGKDSMFITFYFVPQKAGSIKGHIRVNENEFDINHFIFP